MFQGRIHDKISKNCLLSRGYVNYYFFWGLERKIVPRARLELATHGLGIRCSISDQASSHVSVV
jgi:hypothetical protein